jgi:tetratricopeptide (TPR) repeat protein
VEATDRFRVLAREVHDAPDLWLHLAAAAAKAERPEVSLDACRHALALDPGLAGARLAAGSALVRLRKLDEAAAFADSVTTLVPDDPASLARAHELLARIALQRRDVEAARAEADMAEASDPARPVRAYVDGRIAYDQGRFAAAADEFDAALAALAKSRTDPPADLRYFAADTLMRVDRSGEAEYLLQQELHDYPFNSRVRSALAALYRSTGRGDDAAAILAAR